jgi:Plavaka transposase
MTGNRVAHPLLISLANIAMGFRTKSTNDLFLLLALLPIPKFLHENSKIRGILESRLVHQCLDIILAPLKIAARLGVLMEDPLGWRRVCFPPLAAYIVDTPESALMACVAGKTSSVTMAYFKQFGDNYQHEPRTASTTLAKLQAVEAIVDPWNLGAYEKEAMKFRLNGVHRPFWRDWPLSDPSVFLTPEPLHHWHKGFWDHDAKWCIHGVGSREIDFRFAILHPHTGFRHFKEGISSLKQVTGREHRDVQRYIVAVIIDAVPQGFLIAIRALMDFRYLAQAQVITEETCTAITNSLCEFHDHKQAILDAGARRGKKEVIENWYIPKLEFLQSVVPNIRENGVAIQWSADTTEHANITAIKDPARSGNNQHYEPQICRYLDRLDKLRQFDLGTAIKEAKIDFRADPRTNLDGAEQEDAGLDESEAWNITSSSCLLTHIDPVSSLSGTSRHTADYFYTASALKQLSRHQADIPLPLRTNTCSRNVAFHLARDPSYKRLSVDEVSQLYCLPDLRPALSDYLQRTAGGHETNCLDVGGRRLSLENCPLPFTDLEVWTKVYLQSKSYHPPHLILPPQTINAGHPSSPSTPGHYDSVIMNVDPTKVWPSSGLSGLYLFFSTPRYTDFVLFFRTRCR